MRATPQQLLSFTLMGFVMLGAAAQAAMALPQTSPLTAQLTSPRSAPRPPRSVVRQVRRDLAQRLNISQRSLETVSFSQETWPDSCLGLAADNERCATATVDGWRIELSDGQQNWVYRTDLTAQVIWLETSDNVTLPPDVSDRLLQAIAQQESVPAASLRILESRSTVWDGCLGIYEPNQACTMIGISGWQVIVAGENQNWVYHVDYDGSGIIQNSTASGSQGGLLPSFIPTGNLSTEPVDSTVIFRVTTSGGLAGIVNEVILSADGTIYRQVSQPNSPRPSEPVIEKRLSPEQVQQFQQVLETQRFPNLNGLRYITDIALADYPTTTLHAMGGQVEYIDLELENLPEALQEVIQAWEGL